MYLDTHIALEKANHTIKIREASLDSALAENRSFKEKQAIIRNNCALGGKNSAGKKKEY